MQKPKSEHLCEAERAIIQLRIQEQVSQRTIAREIGRSQSTISRELQRNGDKRTYWASKAQQKAAKRRKEKKPRRRAITPELQNVIVQQLEQHWSPEQISGRIRLEQGGGPGRQSIYEFIYEDKKRGGGLYKNLRINGKRRYRRRAGRKRDKIPDRQDIELRPEVVEKRQRLGDWEADLICGCRGGGYLLSVYERRSRLGRLILLESKSATETTEAIIAALKEYGVETITYDNGPEFAGHGKVSEALGCQGYFCKPYHSWEKGGVENYNGLVRQYLPAGTNMLEAGRDEVRRIEAELNSRPRKCLAYRTPLEEYKSLAA